MATPKYSTMGLHDDIFYTTVKLPVGCYPRIEYFQSELQDLFPRFLGVHKRLPECVKLSADRLDSISNAVQKLTNSTPLLFMFGPTHTKIPVMDLVYKTKPNKPQTHPFEEVRLLGKHANSNTMVLAMCTLRMMDKMKGRDALRKVISVFGVENMMFYVDKEYERNRDMVANTLGDLVNLLKLKKGKQKVAFESKMEIISNDINNHMERKFGNTFVSLKTLLLEITEKRSRTHSSISGYEFTGSRFYREVRTQLKNVLTVTDLLVTSEGVSTEQKLATAIVAFTKTLLIREIAATFDIKDEKVFDYCQKENCSDIWVSSLEKHLCKLPLVKKFYQFVRTPNDESVKRDIEQYYTLEDAKTIGKEVTKALTGYFSQVWTDFKNIRVNLNLLTSLRKEIERLIEKTIDGDKYVECAPKLELWRKKLQGIKEVQGMGFVLGKLVVFIKPTESKERESEIRTHVERLLKGFPREFGVECVSFESFMGRHGAQNNPKIVIGDGYLSECGGCGTIGLFMHEYVDDKSNLHFLTSSHVVLGSKVVTTNDQNPVLLGRTRHEVLIDKDNSLVDIAVIQIEEAIRDRCNIIFIDNGDICRCNILDMKAIQNLKEGEHVYKRGSTTGETKGCIISEDFRGSGLKDHNFLVSVPVGSDEAVRDQGFAQEGDSGAVLYVKAPDGEIQFIALLMGQFILKEREENPNSTFRRLTKETGCLFLTTCLREGLDRIENKFKLKLNLPTF